MEIDLFDLGILEWPEEWRPVKGYEGLYEVSSYGRIRSYLRRGGKNRVIKEEPVYIKTFTSTTGYVHAHLVDKDKKWKNIKLHRIVANAFIPNPDNLPIINHKDENPLNNHVYNLEWCTYKYNANYGTARERAKERRKQTMILKKRMM